MFEKTNSKNQKIKPINKMALRYLLGSKVVLKFWRIKNGKHV